MGKRISNIYLPNNLRHKLQRNIEKIEFKKDLVTVFRFVVVFGIISSIILAVYINMQPFMALYNIVSKIVMGLSIAIIGFFVFYAIYWSLFAIYIDLKLYQKTKQIEVNLPDYLEFTSANLRAGMPIDKALWLAIRPRFGPLAIEMEKVAKDTMSGEELSSALKKFANKYDSPVLQRTVSLLNEGLEAGGKISDLITKIAWNLNDVGIIKKEIAASVLNYIIFIGFATIIAAPILFSLSTMLLNIISGLGTLMPTGSATGSMQMMPVGFFQSGITSKDFNIYAYLSLSVTAVFSSMIVSIIRKGKVKDGLKYIPIFLISSLLIYTIARKTLEMLFGGII
jgi:Flp pilus assembly protein TadB